MYGSYDGFIISNINNKYFLLFYFKYGYVCCGCFSVVVVVFPWLVDGFVF